MNPSEPVSAYKLRNEFARMSDLDVNRYYYCYEIGSTFTALSLMESSLTNSMTICDKVVLDLKLGVDAKMWHDIARKQEQLQGSTLGNLISILSKHGLQPDDLTYLRWLKKKRDFFIHRYFNIGCWPGEMNEGHIKSLVRTLRYLQLIYVRASRRVWNIFVRAGLLQVVDFGGDGNLLTNERAFEFD